METELAPSTVMQVCEQTVFVLNHQIERQRESERETEWLIYAFTVVWQLRPTLGSLINLTI